jgi:hypothetical protein
MILGWVIIHLLVVLIKLIEFNATLKEDLEKYEGEFKSDEVLNL